MVQRRDVGDGQVVLVAKMERETVGAIGGDVSISRIELVIAITVQGIEVEIEPRKLDLIGDLALRSRIASCAS